MTYHAPATSQVHILRRWQSLFVRVFAAWLLLIAGVGFVEAQETVCASVKIQIKQQLTLERQGFDAEMKISNTLDTASLSEVKVDVKVTDELGVPVPISFDANDISAKFFIRIFSKEAISDVSGTGVVSPKTTAIIDWLLIPAPGAAGSNPLGKKFLVGATLQYKFGGETHTLDVSPDVITVKPLPLLTLDYFLTKDVLADDPLTVEIEPVVPYTLGVRVKNSGAAIAKNVKIDSAQPKIIENKQGLLIGFQLTGSYVNDAPVVNSLLINFNDIQPGTSKIGRWIMESTLAGTFVDFTARFTHSDELGGALTSLIQAVNTHSLIRDVRVDLPGRDMVRDFLAQDGDAIRVYESDGPDTVVTNLSISATLVPTANINGNAGYKLTAPATSGFIYVKLPDPFKGQKALGQIIRSDAKIMLPENVWLSQTRNETTKKWEYWINFFDVNTPGSYNTEFKAPPVAAKVPLLQFIPDRTVTELQQVSFLVQGSSPAGNNVTIAAAPLPVGAKFTDQGNGTAVFDWTPAAGQAGNYAINYTISDGTLSASQSASITVFTQDAPAGPTTPTIVTPLPGARIATLQPTLTVLTGEHPKEPTTAVVFELYADAAMTQLVGTATKAKSALQVEWPVTQSLNDDTNYYWRARTTDGNGKYSLWVNGQFFTVLFNKPPRDFTLASPAINGVVTSATPTFTLNNASDPDNDTISYGFLVYRNSALSDVVASVGGILPGVSGTTSWNLTLPLSNGITYYWRAVATDSNGATTQTPARPFSVNLGNHAPTAPSISSPVANAQIDDVTVSLIVANATDADGNTLTYVFDIDTVNTFDSGNRRTSGSIAQNSAGSTNWSVAGLSRKTTYYWRAKANDGMADGDWVVGSFFVKASNEAPPAPTVNNPGDQAWVATLQPTLQANAVTDPNGDTVSYQFEVFTDLAGSNRVANGSASLPAWQIPTPLADKKTYYWHVRAIDSAGATSAWSAMATFYVSSQPYVTPTIALTAPGVLTDGRSRSVTIQWNGVDPNIDATIALYYDHAGSGYAGVLIVDGLKQSAGSQQGSYVWDLTGLPPGDYYLYGVIYDAKSAGRAYAAGPVVIPNETQAGSLVVTPTSGLRTTVDGGTALFSVKLGSAPVNDVTVPLTTSNAHEGYPQPNTLTFTPTNWSTPQSVTVWGVANCVPDGDMAYQVNVASAVSLDPNYNGVPGATVSLVNADTNQQPQTTNDSNLFVCSYSMLSRKTVTGGYEYAFRARMTNTGVASNGAALQLSTVPSGITIVNGALSFGAVGTGETGLSGGVFTIRSTKLLTLPYAGVGLKWNVISK